MCLFTNCITATRSLSQEEQYKAGNGDIRAILVHSARFSFIFLGSFVCFQWEIYVLK